MTPDANGWYRIADFPPPDDAQRVMYFYPAAERDYEAHVAMQKAFVPESQWWRPTHWQPEPAHPVDSKARGRAA